MIAEAYTIARETYFAILMDRESGGPVMVGSPEGGMDIEEVAEKTPHLIFKVNLSRRWQVANRSDFIPAQNSRRARSLKSSAGRVVPRVGSAFFSGSEGMRSCGEELYASKGCGLR